MGCEVVVANNSAQNGRHSRSLGLGLTNKWNADLPKNNPGLGHQDPKVVLRPRSKCWFKSLSFTDLNLILDLIESARGSLRLGSSSRNFALCLKNLKLFG